MFMNYSQIFLQIFGLNKIKHESNNCNKIKKIWKRTFKGKKYKIYKKSWKIIFIIIIL